MSGLVPAPPASAPTVAADTNRWPIRLWPALVILAIAAVLLVIPGLILPRTMVHFVALFGGPALCSLALAVWWAFGARVRGRDRWLMPALLLVPAAVLGATLFRAFPRAVAIYFLPAVALLGVIWLGITRSWPRGARRAGLTFVMLAGWGAAGTVRFEGADGDLVPDLHWRWRPTAEERFLADRKEDGGRPVSAVELSAAPGDWPEFRGRNRDSKMPGVVIDTAWVAHPPSLVWKHRVGPGWGSFAVVGDRLFTQEQRGPHEAVVCYAAATGQEVWEHREPVRFEEAMAGAGPRSTPTFHEGNIYAQGATGKLVCLDAATGKPRWITDVTDGPGGETPQWGYSASPLVIQGVVVVYAGGPNGKGTAAYKADTGDWAWAAGRASNCYTSAQRAVLGGVEQIVMVSGYGIEGIRPSDGAELWAHVWPITNDLYRVTQPTLLGDTDLVFATGVGGDQGIRRLRVTKVGGKWDVKVVWSTRAVRPYYNDGVVHNGHYYGFDGERFCCVDLETGRQVWKEGQYGHGQVLLLEDQGLLLIQAVNGSVVLAEANPTELNELTKFQAIKGKTWNHPVVVRDKLFVRNGEEAACYRLKVR